MVNVKRYPWKRMACLIEGTRLQILLRNMLKMEGHLKGSGQIRVVD